MNVVTGILSGTFVPWFLFPMLGWGMGFGIHTLNHRTWVAMNRQRVIEAETKLGITPPAPVPRLSAGASVAPHDPWAQLLADCDAAVERAKSLVEEIHPAATDAVVNLEDGLATVARLADGAERIQDVLNSLAPDGSSGLERQIAELDQRISETSDASLREAHLANRALLLSRKAKLEALQADQDRMFAKAQGFLFAVENLHLDAARVAGPEATELLSAPIHRLTEEVQILRRVDLELKEVGRN